MLGKLSATRIEQEIKKLKDKNKTLSDGYSLNLTLYAKNKGKGLWRQKIKVDGKIKQITIGHLVFNKKTIKNELLIVREKAYKIREEMGATQDPEVKAVKLSEDQSSIIKDDGKAKTKKKKLGSVKVQNSFTQMLERYLQVRNLKENTIKHYRTLEKAWNKTNLKDLPVNIITLKDIEQAFYRMYHKEKKFPTIKQVVHLLIILRNFGSKLNIFPHPNLLDISLIFKPTEVKNRAMIEREEDIDLFLSKLIIPTKSRAEVYYQITTLIALLSSLRINEINSLEIQEIEKDNVYGFLRRIPKEKMKNKQEHVFPLSSRLIKLLILQEKAKLLIKTSNQISNQFLNNRKFKTPYKISIHGFRATCSTLLNKYYPDKFHIISTKLSHARQGINSVDLIYNRYKYVEQLRDLQEKWEELLQRYTDLDFYISVIEKNLIDYLERFPKYRNESLIEKMLD